MRWLSLPVAVLCSTLAAWLAGHAGQAPAHAERPFSFFSPVVELGADEIERIRRGRVVSQTVDSSGHELAVLAAGQLNVTPDAFVSRVMDIVQLRKSRLVPVVARFSSPPTLDDLAALTLSAKDLERLRDCRPGDCGLKLADAEIRRMQAAMASGGVDHRSAAEREFREILLDRVRAYLDRGLEALPPYHDKSQPIDIAAAFARLVDRSVYLDRVPQFRASLGGPPAADATDSYVYWSIEDFGRKHLIRVTHVVIVRPGVAGLPAVLVGSTQIYANHYVDAALAITTLERGAEGGAYLGYLYRARVDVLGNVLVRGIVKRRIKEDVERLFVQQLERLEGV